jgi:hypothetical protein
VQVEPERFQFRHRIGVVERPAPERLVVPDVLADGDRHAAAPEPQHERPVAGLEVAALVEHVVGREQPLAVEGDALAAPRRDGGVEHLAAARAPVRRERAEDPHRLARGAGDPVRGCLGGRDERRALDEVPGRVSADGQLGEEDEVGPGFLGAAPVRQDLRDVAGEVADGRIDLRDGDPQRRPTPFSQE